MTIDTAMNEKSVRKPRNRLIDPEALHRRVEAFQSSQIGDGGVLC